jgi:hypothetical protein
MVSSPSSPAPFSLQGEKGSRARDFPSPPPCPRPGEKTLVKPAGLCYDSTH